MKFFSLLNREQKEAIGLLQIGTFLEYFDLMLYIHMAVLLNELFFPKSDPQTTAIISAFTFSTTFAMRPIGALLFGWLGDTFGRKSTIILTTLIMACSCLIMANLPTYSEIGITAAWVMICCRMAQGLSSMSEIVGAEIYVAESISRPASYPAVSFLGVAANLGSMAALGVSFLVTAYLFNWRIAFWIGAAIAIVGSVARTRLRETPDFLKMKRLKMKQTIAALQHEDSDSDVINLSSKSKDTWKDAINKKTLLSYFFIYCGPSLTFYLGYIYFNPLLKDTFGYSSAQIIEHNFILAILFLFSQISWASLGFWFHPIRVMKVRAYFIAALMFALPFTIPFIDSPLKLFCTQAAILIFSLSSVPGDAIFVYHLPIHRRFTFASLLGAFSSGLIYVLTAFGLVYLTSHFGTYGLWMLTLPLTFASFYGIFHFEQLERKIGIYPNMTFTKEKASRHQKKKVERLPISANAK